ncbi:hypothetical protein KL949_004516 [Ogataea haglerorum]|nr:hypothetical protein KL913_004521 [Ogataea haglerorum]KAG7715123.1 hypothetical protein KL949_004516 [Ogataea haglerorum]
MSVKSEESSVPDANGSFAQTCTKLHRDMLARGQSSYTQEELLEISKMDSNQQLMKCVQELLNRGIVRLLESKDRKVLFQPITEAEAVKINNMSSDEAMVYSYIEAAGREGIWTKTIKAKTNLHQHVVQRCLKSLESQSYIKSVKSVKYPQRKIYMLYHLTPSIEVTGGPWFTDSELDSDFIDSLLIVIWRFVASKSYPKCFKKGGMDVEQYSYPVSNNHNLPSLEEISRFIGASGVTSVELSLSDIRSLCSVLEYEEKLVQVDNLYKATWQSVLEAGGGRYRGVNVFAPQHNQIFSISDTYRVMNPLGDTEENKDDTLYLDSWMST